MRHAGEFHVIRAERRLTKRQRALLDRRGGWDARSGKDRRQVAIAVPSDRRSGEDRRVADRRQGGDRRAGERRNPYRQGFVLDEDE